MQNAQHEAIVAATETDDKQAPAARAILRGVTRVMATHGLATVSELPLPNGRRADAIGLARDGDILIVEIKSCAEDFRSDHKWQDYRECCDKLYFAVQPGFPVELLMGQLSYVETLTGFALQTGWLAVAVVLCWLAWTRGLRRFTAVGG